MKYTHVHTLLLMLVFHTSCEPNQTKEPKENINPIAIKSETKDVISSHGPNSITRTIEQDRSGNIWIATFQGVFQYDGKSFTNMTSEVSSARFFSVLEDRKGNFWLGSIGSGDYYYDGKSFQNFTTKDGLVNNEITSIYEDNTGNIWFGVNGGVSRYDGKSFRNYIMNGDSIIEDRKGNIWTSSQGTQGWVLSRYDEKSLSHKKPAITEINPNEGRMLFGILEANDGSIWFGAGDGVYRYDGNTITDFKVNSLN